MEHKDNKYDYALLSKCGKYRWLLHRRINDSKREIIFVGLNPSIADRKQNDHTIKRILDFSKNWGYGDLRVINLFGIISTDSKLIKSYLDPIGTQNDILINATLKRWSENKDCDLWIGWGARGKYMNRNRHILKKINRFILLRNKNFNIKSNALIIGLTKGGDPRHPLYASKKIALKKY